MNQLTEPKPLPMSIKDVVEVIEAQNFESPEFVELIRVLILNRMERIANILGESHLHLEQLQNFIYQEDKIHTELREAYNFVALKPTSNNDRAVAVESYRSNFPGRP